MEKSKIEVDCERLGSVEIKTGSIRIRLASESPLWNATNRVVFVRPSLKKLPAVAIYNSILTEFAQHAPSWSLAHINVKNSERISYKSFAQFHRLSKPPGTDISGQRFFIVTHEPDDALELYLRGICPRSSLILLGSKGYLSNNPVYAQSADLIVTDQESDNFKQNSLVCADLSKSAALIHHWVQSWAFTNNSEHVRLFGEGLSEQDGGTLLSQPGISDAELLVRLGPDNREAPKLTAGSIRRAFAQRVELAYIKISILHKYSGIFDSPQITNVQKIDELLRRGVRLREFQSP